MTTANNICVYAKCLHKKGEVAFFKFPIQDVERTREWQKNCGNINIAIMDPTDLKQRCIYENHFLPEDIRINSFLP